MLDVECWMFFRFGISTSRETKHFPIGGNFFRRAEFFPAMNRFLFTIPVAFAAILATSASVFAEEEKPKPERPAARGAAERLKTMTEKLGLTEEQQGKIREIFAKTAPKAKALREDTALSEEDKRAKMMELRKGEAEEIRAVLTPEQQEKMKALRKEGKAGKAAK